MIYFIENWMITLGIINLILLILSILFIIPKNVFKTKISQLYHYFKNQFLYLMIIIIIVIFHLIEVNYIDQNLTEWIGYDFANIIITIEDNIIYNLSKNTYEPLIYIFVYIYIGIYPFILWFSPCYYLITNNIKSIKTLTYGLTLIYIIALPFYLFIPVKNVYTYYNLESTLNQVMPNVENFFYTTTTNNNCFPSLHTAMTILIARTTYITGNKKLFYFTSFCTIGVIIAVIYLAIHWILDTIFGILLAFSVILLLQRIIKE